MYVYVAKFAAYADLVKIGVSANVPARMAQLIKWHGKVVNLDKFRIGDENGRIEKFLHGRFKRHKVTSVVGDGCTEFFKDCVYTEAVGMLSALVVPTNTVEEKIDALQEEEHFLYAQIEAEKVRAINFIRSVFDRSSKKIDSTAAQFSCWTECLSVYGALSIGFSEAQVFKKAAKAFSKEKSFTTPRRIELAYKAYKGGDMTGSKVCQNLVKDVRDVSNKRLALQILLKLEANGQTLTREWVLNDEEARHYGRAYTDELLKLCPN